MLLMEKHFLELILRSTAEEHRGLRWRSHGIPLGQLYPVCLPICTGILAIFLNCHPRLTDARQVILIGHGPGCAPIMSLIQQRGTPASLYTCLVISLTDYALQRRAL